MTLKWQHWIVAKLLRDVHVVQYIVYTGVYCVLVCVLIDGF